MMLCTLLIALLYVHNIYACIQIKSTYDSRFTSAPLHYIPFADDDEIVLSSKLLEIHGLAFTGAYNPSIEISSDHYLVTFRLDNMGQGLIGIAAYDKDFKQIGNPILFDIQDILLPHDPRLFYYNNQLHMLYTYTIFNNITSLAENDVPPWKKLSGIQQRMVSLTANYELYDTIELKYGTNFEKNWTPFEYNDEHGGKNLYFVYKFNPLEIVQISKSKKIRMLYKEPLSTFLKEHWEDRWGSISGGTAATLIDHEYLTFFHSYFNVGRKRIYVMGALTFNADPPFSIKRISRYPIIFRNCYTAYNGQAQPWGKSNIKYVLFPGGFIKSKQNAQDTLILACGENDCAIRIITVNQKKLLKSMRTI